MTREYNKDAVVSAMIKNPVILDTHDNKTKKLLAVVEFKNDYKELGAVIDCRGHQCLNAVYLYEDGLHLSMMSIGGIAPELTHEGIRKYNESCLFEGGHILKIYFNNGTILELENKNNKDIINAFNYSTFLSIINDYDNMIEDLVAIVELSDGSLAGYLNYSGKVQMLNAIYLDEENKFHLSTDIIGAGIRWLDQESVRKYNETYNSQIKRVYYRGGGVMEVED